MSTTTNQNNFMNPRVLFNFNHLEKPVQTHLKNVYSTLSIGLITAGITSYLFCTIPYVRMMATNFMFLTSILSFISVLYIHFTENNSENINKRLGAFLAFAGFTGLSMGPLIHMSLAIDPEMVTTAFFTTSAIFVSFTLSALMSNRKSFIFLGGILGSSLSTLVILSLVNMFISSNLIFSIQLYGGLLIFCGFVLFDTQIICEKRRLGNTDFVKHSLELFLDFIEIFKHILIILNDKNNKKRKNRDD